MACAAQYATSRCSRESEAKVGAANASTAIPSTSRSPPPAEARSHASGAAWPPTRGPVPHSEPRGPGERTCKTTAPPTAEVLHAPTPAVLAGASTLPNTSRPGGHRPPHLGNWRPPMTNPIPHVHFNDSTRQAALFETMILAAAADGAIDKVELEEIYRRVFERPEFHGIH